MHLDDDKLGLGARIHAQLGGPAVVGVAKHEFHGASSAVAVRRGTSKHPLFVGAIGIALDEAVAGVARMHGRHRIPTLLARVDRLSRT